MSEDGTGMSAPQGSGSPSGAVNSTEVGRKKPSQARLKSGIQNKKPATKIDTNKHGIRRETNLVPKKTGPKKV